MLAAKSPSKIPSLIELNNVCLNLNGNSVLQNISFKLNANEIVTVIGPNGAGKSSLINVVVGLQAPSIGSVLRRPQLRIGYMPQKLSIDKQLPLTTQRFLSLCGTRAALLSAVVRLDIACLLKTPVQNLSGGETQRVLLARALMQNPELLVLDEPAQGVDVAGQAELYHLLGELRRELACGILMVSHDLHIVMAQTDKILCLNRHICCQGEPESVAQDPGYLQLFGKKIIQDIAIYNHNHDHQHNIHGAVVEDGQHQTHQHNPSQHSECQHKHPH
jgi:zinc transport system ATP-binding protein